MCCLFNFKYNTLLSEISNIFDKIACYLIFFYICVRLRLCKGILHRPQSLIQGDIEMAKRIVLTGGGTAGHVTPNIALLPSLQEAGYEIYYIGSYSGIESTLMSQQNIPYFGISTGKLRRYFDWQNFTDPFRVVHGYFQAKKILKKLKPDVIFSKGGFVSVPVVRAAGKLHIPAIIHESDMTPGLANRLSIPVADKVCCSFPETLKYLPPEKAVLTGSPIRRELLQGDRKKGLAFIGWEDSSKPTLLVTGGSQGSAVINQALRQDLDILLKDIRIIHLCGKGNLDKSLEGREGYVQLEYVTDELKDLFALADFVLSRAGANSICELLALRKPNLLIPLSAASSRGDQILNADSYQRQGYSLVLKEEKLTPESLVKSLKELYQNKDQYIEAMSKGSQSSAIDMIMELINAAAT